MKVSRTLVISVLSYTMVPCISIPPIYVIKRRWITARFTNWRLPCFIVSNVDLPYFLVYYYCTFLCQTGWVPGRQQLYISTCDQWRTPRPDVCTCVQMSNSCGCHLLRWAGSRSGQFALISLNIDHYLGIQLVTQHTLNSRCVEAFGDFNLTTWFFKKTVFTTWAVDNRNKGVKEIGNVPMFTGSTPWESLVARDYRLILKWKVLCAVTLPSAVPPVGACAPVRRAWYCTSRPTCSTSVIFWRNWFDVFTFH